MPELSGEVRWVQTAKRNIQNPTVTKKVDEKEVASLIGNVDKYVAEHAIQAEGLVSVGLGIARSAINRLRKKNNMQPLPDGTMSISILIDDDYLAAYKLLGARKSYITTTALASSDLDSVLVRKTNIPIYQLVAGAYHELVHKHIDNKVRVYTNDDGQVISNFRRGGL